ncbi:protein YgfX [Proteus faecis]|uniref:Protein YgfX n=1 Tax=Proteus faecis TaxID=2050967 RepID=A0AAW7CQR9_9GAMM|nr:protein YgfX [Proteus faecis]MBG3012908.1 protein YgfX [Proteus mirabilis]MDL5166499.1 protein YgfX [Proteus faecis]MDL5274483.1 protein YgfX [Proteus faecis]MDL5278053.1 protein YgfX [Proteus faecis]MDL5307055.1 protein YgfX [Proteus faecis]
MILWKSHLTVSWFTQLFSTVAYVAFVIALLLYPWPPDFIYVWVPLLLFLISSWYFTQKSISRIKGDFILLNGNRIQWKLHEWQITKRPWISRFGTRITLTSILNKKQITLWVAFDSMTENEWRNFSQLLMQYPDI